jgi:hypothetical protein
MMYRGKTGVGRLRHCVQLAALALMGLSLLTGVSGCGQEEPPPPPPPPPAPPPPPPPTPADIAEFMNMHPRVNLDLAQQQGSDEEMIRAVLEFANDFAAGDHAALRPRLDSTGRTVLDELVNSSVWDREIRELRELKLLNTFSAGSQTVVTFQILMTRGRVLNQGWSVSRRGDRYLFAPMADAPVGLVGGMSEATGDPGTTILSDGTEEDDDDHRRPTDPRRLVPREHEHPIDH